MPVFFFSYGGRPSKSPSLCQSGSCFGMDSVSFCASFPVVRLWGLIFPGLFVVAPNACTSDLRMWPRASGSLGAASGSFLLLAAFSRQAAAPPPSHHRAVRFPNKGSEQRDTQQNMDRPCFENTWEMFSRKSSF